jgi:hypothetical protein
MLELTSRTMAVNGIMEERMSLSEGNMIADHADCTDGIAPVGQGLGKTSGWDISIRHDARVVT